jgi:hypothetical protein
MPFKQEDFQPFFGEVTTLAADGWRPALIVYFKPDAPEQVLMMTHELYQGKEVWLLEQMLWAAKHKVGERLIPRARRDQ